MCGLPVRAEGMVVMPEDLKAVGGFSATARLSE
jgi:hypothetical protein